MAERCFYCETSVVEIARGPDTFTLSRGLPAPVTVTIPNEFCRCTSCGEEWYTPEQSLAHSAKVKAALAEKGIEWPKRNLRRRTPEVPHE